MKKTYKILLAVILLIAVTAAIFSYSGRISYEIPPVETELFIEARSGIVLENPYDDVNWVASGRYRANLHTHTRMSDGLYSPARVIDSYYKRGYKILALADHNNVTWPWEVYGKDPDELGMLAIQANEISDTHHIGSYFNDFNIEGRKYRPIFWSKGQKADIDEDGVIREIGARGGLAVFFHPGRYDYDAEYYARFYEEYDHLVGMEVINQRDRYPYDREIWDQVLTLLMPERPVWGFSNDDMHIMRHLGYCYNIFLLDEFTEEDFRSAMESGRFFFSHGLEAPAISDLIVDNATGTIEITAEGYNEIVWISDGKVIHHGKNLNFRETPNIGTYIRAKLIGEGGNTYTNPFGVLEDS